MKKYESGGPTTTRSVDTNEYGSTGEVEKTKRNGNQKLKTVEISNYGSSMAKPSSTPTARIDKQKYDANGMEIGYKTKNISVDKAQRKINRISNRASAKTGGYMKTGGMVNANAKITAAKAATGRVGGVTKAISKVAVKSTSPKGRVGGISKAPKKASIKKK